jgi:hypothetical protein
MYKYSQIQQIIFEVLTAAELTPSRAACPGLDLQERSPDSAELFFPNAFGH